MKIYEVGREEESGTKDRKRDRPTKDMENFPGRIRAEISGKTKFGTYLNW